LKKIVDLCHKYGGNKSLSVEVFSNDPKEMLEQGEKFVKELDYKHLRVKVQIAYKGTCYLNVVREFTERGVPVNCTAMMTPLQALLAAAAGAKYVSLFYNRIKDATKGFDEERAEMLASGTIDEGDFDPNKVVRETRQLLEHYPNAEIIAGSIRSASDIKYAGLAGAHIVTAGPKVVLKSLQHYKTDEAVGQFMTDFAKWLSND
jgi:transaldolase